MQEKIQKNDEHEILIRAIDLLTMEILRLKTENEILKRKNQEKEVLNGKKTNQYENIWSKARNYYHHQGFLNTIKKVISKLVGK